MAYKDKEYAKKYYQENKEKISSYSRDYNKANRAKRNAYKKKRRQELRAFGIKRNEKYRPYKSQDRIRKYQIDIKSYNELLKSQDNACAICRNSETAISKKTGKVKPLSIDHDHETNKVRGLLCYRCNIALGFFKDSVDNLEAAIAYLKNTRTQLSVI